MISSKEITYNLFLLKYELQHILQICIYKDMLYTISSFPMLRYIMIEWGEGMKQKS